jgi:hypothetical protein
MASRKNSQMGDDKRCPPGIPALATLAVRGGMRLNCTRQRFATRVRRFADSLDFSIPDP